MIESDKASNPRKITRINLLGTSTILALLISVPAITITLIMHYAIRADLIITVLASLVALFVGMGFSVKVSKKLVRY